MRIAVLGAGPAGLLFSLLAKRRHPAWRVEVFEQNPPDATFGFGVVFSQGALAFLERDAPDLYRQLLPRMETWPIQRIVHRDERVDIDGNGFSSIARLKLNQFLIELCRGAGVQIGFGHTVVSLDELSGADVIVAADGVNSLVRRTLESAVRAEDRVAHQQVRVVRHHAAVRVPDAHLSRERARRIRRAPLPLRAGHEHFRRGVRCADLGKSGLRDDDR